MKDHFKRNRIIGVTILLILFFGSLLGIATLIYSLGGDSLSPLERAKKILSDAPLIDGHNDFAYNLRKLVYNDLRKVNFSKNLSQIEPWRSHNYSQTDIPRLRAGHVGVQFWVARADCDSQYKDAVGITLEQIDVIKVLIANYSDDLMFIKETKEIEKASDKGKIGCLIGVEGGHSIQGSLAILRQFYELGVRYLTLAQFCGNSWVDSSSVDHADKLKRPLPFNQGLSKFGENVVLEMNRLGMIVDISHVSITAMEDVLRVSKAPVIFSHSSAKGLCDIDRNIPDSVLKLLGEKEGVIMVNFYSGYLKCDGSDATIQDVINHLDYIRNITSVDSIGIGSDFDGIDRPPVGLEDVSKFPDLFAALVETDRWSDEDLEKLAGKNILRVFEEVEKLRDDMKDDDPVQDWIPRSAIKKAELNYNCTSPSGLPVDPLPLFPKFSKDIYAQWGKLG